MQELTLKPVLKPRKKYLERSSLLPIFQVWYQTWLGQQTTSISKSKQATSKDLVTRKGAKHIATKPREDYVYGNSPATRLVVVFLCSLSFVIPTIGKCSNSWLFNCFCVLSEFSWGRKYQFKHSCVCWCNVSPAYTNWYKHHGLWTIKWILKTAVELKILTY